MTINERAAYIKGLADGLNLDDAKPEVKVIKEMIGLISDISDYLVATDEEIEGVCEVIDDLSDDLSQLEEDFDDLTDFLAEDDDDFEYDEDFEDDDFDIENPDYEVKCPDCGAEIVVDEDTLLEGEINCPNCGNELEFDFSSLFADEVCNCGEPDCPACNPNEDIPF